MPVFENLGDRMKFYEQHTMVDLMPGLPVIARLDGKAFHSFTRGLDRPFDVSFNKLMTETTKYLVDETVARIGYTQSDEITLIWEANGPKSQIFMDGRVFKMQSILAAMASVFFNRKLNEYLPSKSGQMPIFDCRVWNVPSREEAVNVLIWREQDATRNSISMAAQSVHSHKQLHKKSSNEMQEMLFEKGINWNEYPSSFKRGVYVQRYPVERPFTTDEIEKLPQQHEARKNPDLVVLRHEVRISDMPVMTTVCNKNDVVFDGKEPLENHLIGCVWLI